VSLVEGLLRRAALDRGVCVVLGENAAALAAAVARRTRLLVEVVEADFRTAAASRGVLDAAGLYGTRVTVTTSPPGRLPYADNLIDAVLCGSASPAALGTIRAEEVLRVLRPGGCVVLRNAAPADGLAAWAGDAQGQQAPVERDALGSWVRLGKPVPAGAADWTHWQHGPDNNPVSRDLLVKPPFLTQFLAEPWFTAVPSVSVISGGRQFRASGHLTAHERERPYLNTLYATSAYNGSPLWTRPLPEGFLTQPSLFVATPEALFLADGRRCLVLDPATGAQRGEIVAPNSPADGGYWKWLAVENGTLFGLVGNGEEGARSVARTRRRGATEPGKGAGGAGGPGSGDLLAAIAPQTKQLRWTYAPQAPIAPRSLCMAAGRIFLHCEGVSVDCLDAKTGTRLWRNSDRRVLAGISVPFAQGAAFQLSPYALCTDKAVYFGGQGRRKVLALSATDGKLLWTVSGADNATNLVLVDGKLMGHVPSCTMLDALTGVVVKDPGMQKQSCARLTGCPGSLFYRGSFPKDKAGEGAVRYDLSTGKSEVSHAFRPPCNDGLLTANGLLQVTPWDCDTNMQLVGALALAPAATVNPRGERIPGKPLEALVADPAEVAAFGGSPSDWPTYRHDSLRSCFSSVSVPRGLKQAWRWTPRQPFTPTPPVAAGGLVFVAGLDCRVRALDAATGEARWQFLTGGPVRQPPTVWQGRLYFGCADGYVYALEAATGRPLWRFRAAPWERRIIVYGAPSATWPVNSGVLVQEGTVYAAAGLIDNDGTYVLALDAVTGKPKWQNATSGHLDPERRAGVSVQGDLTVAGGKLWLAGGNTTSPAGYDLATGECLNAPPGTAGPAANRGREVTGFLGKYVMVGGPRLFTQEDESLLDWIAPYEIVSADAHLTKSPARFRGMAPPAFGNGAFVIAGKGPLVCLDTDAGDDWIADPQRAARRLRWKADALTNCVALALTTNAVVAVGTDGSGSSQFLQVLALTTNAVVAVGTDGSGSSQFLQVLDLKDGRTLASQTLPSPPLPGGLCVDGDGRAIAVLKQGAVVCYASG